MYLVYLGTPTCVSHLGSHATAAALHSRSLMCLLFRVFCAFVDETQNSLARLQESSAGGSLTRTMCSSDPALPKEVKCAKCMGIAIFVFAILSMIGFIGGAIAGAVAGIMACVASSILMYAGSRRASRDAPPRLQHCCLTAPRPAVSVLGAAARRRMAPVRKRSWRR